MSARREISADRRNEIHELARNVARTMRAAKHAQNTGDQMAAANVMGACLIGSPKLNVLSSHEPSRSTARASGNRCPSGVVCCLA